MVSAAIAPYVIAAGSSLAAGGLNYLGTSEQNALQKKMAHEQMAFQRESNREAMGFSERMSSTAYQRSMEDLRKAGLNPILAAGHPAASPGGVSSGGAQAQMQNRMSAAVSSALEARRAFADVANLKAQTAYTEALTQSTKTSAKALSYDLPGKKIEAEIDQSAFGEFFHWLGRVMPAINTAASAARGFR